jgi:hypothetical protein
MSPQELAAHKALPKRLASLPSFKPMKRGKLPKPLHKMGGSRIQATELLPVSDTHNAFFAWRDGEIRTDSAFYAYLFCVLGDGAMSPLFVLHLHPSHKEIHAKLPCKTENDYTNRELPGAPELKLSTHRDNLDPRKSIDREHLIECFCNACGITMGAEGGLWK